MKSDVTCFDYFRAALILLLTILIWRPVGAQTAISKVWVADNGDGTYHNPILHADYSDPDVVRVGRDFYLVASSGNGRRIRRRTGRFLPRLTGF